MPTFCRHNRFIERCPICSKTLPDQERPRRRAAGGGTTGGPRRSAGTGTGTSTRGGARRPRATDVKVYVDGRRRGIEDGYESELVPGLRSSLDARRLAQEIAFAARRPRALEQEPPGAYAVAAQLGREGEIERASWLCFLIAYLSPTDGPEPFASIAQAPSLEAATASLCDEEIDALQLGPRTCHEPGRGAASLRAYLAWARRAGSQRSALTGEESWSAQRRFERVFERLSIPGFPRWGRYELLSILGSLRLYEMSADSLHLAAAPALRAAGKAEAGDPVLAAAKRVFGIGETLLLERRAMLLAEESSVPITALELALFNWLAPARACLGLPEDLDSEALGRAERALGL
jgi:hypothetical protein